MQVIVKDLSTVTYLPLSSLSVKAWRIVALPSGEEAAALQHACPAMTCDVCDTRA